MTRSSHPTGWSAGERGWATLVTVGVVGAALWPFSQYRRPVDDRVDGFPLSYYPMFSARRGTHGHVAYAVGVHADGSRARLPYHLIGPGGVNQVRKQMSRAVRRGRVDEHATALATRIAASPAATDVVRVEIVRGDFDLDACLMQRRVEGEETVLAGADIERPGSVPLTVVPTTVAPLAETAGTA
ncbi:hypothetical protein [Pseudonocardia spinosispora]|uniref:hypothetical protein n=1 Tax=Pseudonocardia spinosispora TaxID=103441 RepID=UPI0003FA03A2|nr:hypothetical protein [Pseudonocardia spinosispora]